MGSFYTAENGSAKPLSIDIYRQRIRWIFPTKSLLFSLLFFSAFYFLLKILLRNNQLFLILISAPLFLRTLCLNLSEQGRLPVPLAGGWKALRAACGHDFSLGRAYLPLLYLRSLTMRTPNFNFSFFIWGMVGYFCSLKEILHRPIVILLTQSKK